MEFKKIINISIIVAVVALSGVVEYEYKQQWKKKESYSPHKNSNSHLQLITNGQIAESSNGENCDNQFLNGIRPVIENTALKERTRELCFKGFAVLHSGITRSPLYAVENLTKERVLGAKAIERQDAFHEETKLPKNERASLKDYERSGYDRGHLAPSDDMSDMQMQEESFSLANIVMQHPKIIESYILELKKK
jgi:DNA/RNA endonuclease G (NUC1)